MKNAFSREAFELLDEGSKPRYKTKISLNSYDTILGFMISSL